MDTPVLHNNNVHIIICLIGFYKTAFSWTGYLIWAGCLVDSASVFVVLLGLGLVRHAVGLVHGCYVVHQGDGLHSLVNSTADGFSNLSGCWSPGGWKVMAGLKRIREGTVSARRTKNINVLTDFFYVSLSLLPAVKRGEVF